MKSVVDPSSLALDGLSLSSSLQVTALKIKYNPFAKAFLDTGNNRR